MVSMREDSGQRIEKDLFIRRVFVWWEQLPERLREVSEKRIFQSGRACCLNIERMILSAAETVRRGLFSLKLVILVLPTAEVFLGAMMSGF